MKKNYTRGHGSSIRLAKIPKFYGNLCWESAVNQTAWCEGPAARPP